MPNVPQFRFFIITTPISTSFTEWSPYHVLSSDGPYYVKGQEESGATTGYRHYQWIAYFKRAITLSRAKKVLCLQASHLEPCRSDKAEEYVWKEETKVPGSEFEIGSKRLKRNSQQDWDSIWEYAKEGRFEEIPPDVRFRFYSTIRRIRSDFDPPQERIKQTVHYYWGKTGTGKSHSVFTAIAGQSFYLKSPTTKWWDGYSGEQVVVIDEFRGTIDVCHLLKWLDKWPCTVEVKGGQVPLKTTTWYIMSNLGPQEVYKDIDHETWLAWRRRLTNVKYFDELINQL